MSYITINDLELIQSNEITGNEKLIITDSNNNSKSIEFESVIEYAIENFDNTVDEKLELKVDKVLGKGLSTEDFTSLEKTKLQNLQNYNHPTSGVSAGTYNSVTVNQLGHVTAGENISTITEYNTFSVLPAAGVVGKFYLTKDTNKAYRWTGTGYVQIGSLVDSVAGRTGNVLLSKLDVGLNNVENTLDANKNVFSATKLTTPRTINGISFDGTANIVIQVEDPTKVLKNSSISGGTATKITFDSKGLVTNGGVLVSSDIPSLDASKITTGIISSDRLPSYVDDILEFTDYNSFPVSGESGKIYVDLTTNKAYRWSGSAYVYITSGAVESVAGKTGVVTLAKADVGLSNVDNTADITKPISTATQTALNLKANIANPTFTGIVNGSFSGPLTGNASTATTLATARTLAITGDLLWTSPAFNGSSNVTAVGTLATISDSGVGSFKKVTVDTKGRVTGTQTVVQTDITGILGAGSITNTMLANSGVTAGTYKSVTVDTKGIVTSGSNPTTLVGYGITDATPSTHIGSTGSSHGIVTTTVNGFMSSTDKTKLDNIASDATANTGTVTSIATSGAITGGTITTSGTISHSTVDGFLHVPATGTTNNGKVLTAGATAGSLSWATISGAGTVTSVGGTGTVSGITLSGNVTSTGTLTLGGTLTVLPSNFASQTANTLLAAPNGSAGVPTFRSIVSADIPILNQNTTGNANTATTLHTTRTFSATGDVTASAQNFNGSANVVLPMVLSNSGVIAGSYSKVTVDAKGRVTVGLIPTMEDIPDATFKRSVRCATTGNITLSAVQTIDGIVLIAGDRVLVKNQTTTSQNGIYVVNAATWTRALDADTSSKISSALVAVDSGTVNGGKLFDNDFKTTDTLGTTAMLWSMNLDDASLLTVGSTSIGTVKYNGTTAAAGMLDGGTTTPTGTNRLNYGGYFYPTFLNLTGSADTATASSHVYVETGSDGFVRPKTLANFKTEMFASPTLVTPNIGVATATSINSTGTIVGAGVLSSGNLGFKNDVSVLNSRNPIWSFGNALTYGISYYQASAGIGNKDTIAFDFGTTTSGSAKFSVTSDGDLSVSGSISSNGVIIGTLAEFTAALG